MPLSLSSPRSPRTIVLWLALWLALVGNLALWRELYRIGGVAHSVLVGIGSLGLVFAALAAMLSLMAWGRPWKIVWIAVAVAAGIAQHFMLTYGAVMDSTMLANTMQTDPREVRDLLSWTFLGNIALVAVPPAVAIALVPVRRTPWWPQLWRNTLLFAASLAVVFALAFALFSRLAPLVRNNMQLRYMVNPIGGITSAAWIGLRPFVKGRATKAIVPITAGVALGPSYAAGLQPPLLVIVVGETARSDHFALNGYARDTTPELARRDVVSFRDVRSCGTDTRASVPCMFSPLGRTGFERRKAEHENLLDLLQAAGLAVLWIDNQAGCKEVCARVPQVSTADLPTDAARALCSEGECVDDALLVGLDARIAVLPAERRQRGVVIVMHQMGSHGPAYFKRSPQRLKRFVPECTNTSLAECDPAELVNAYDNTIATTDDFLARTIDWLRGQQASFAPAMLYMSDHGESLGEYGIFLHGLPYSLAPDAQKHVPFIAWIGEPAAARRGIETGCLRGRRDVPLSHDNLFHTVLGVLDVQSPTYRAELDAFAPCRKAAAR